MPLPLCHPRVHALDPYSLPQLQQSIPRNTHDFSFNSRGIHPQPLKEPLSPSPHLATQRDARTHRTCLRKRPDEDVVNPLSPPGLALSLKAGRPTGRLLTKTPVCHWRQTTGLSPDGISFRCPLLCLFALILTAARLKEDLISIRLSFGFAQHNTSDPTTSHIPHIAYPQTSKTHPKPQTSRV